MWHDADDASPARPVLSANPAQCERARDDDGGAKACAVQEQQPPASPVEASMALANKYTAIQMNEEMLEMQGSLGTAE